MILKCDCVCLARLVIPKVSLFQVELLKGCKSGITRIPGMTDLIVEVSEPFVCNTNLLSVLASHVILPYPNRSIDLFYLLCENKVSPFNYTFSVWSCWLQPKAKDLGITRVVVLVLVGFFVSQTLSLSLCSFIIFSIFLLFSITISIFHSIRYVYLPIYINTPTTYDYNQPCQSTHGAL